MDAGLEPRFDVAAHVLKRWPVLFIAALLGLAGGVVYILVAPKWYQASIVVVTSNPGKSNDLPALDRLPIDLPFGKSGSTNARLVAAVFRSTSISDLVIAKFDLKRRYAVDYQETARLKLWKHCSTAVDTTTSLVTLTCEDKDPRLVTEMVAYFGDIGDKAFRRISVSSAGEERRFLEQRVSEAKRELDESYRKLRAFEEKHKVIELSEQTRAVVSTMAALRGELVAKQVELSYLTSFSSSNESTVIELRQRIAVLDRKLKALEEQQEPAPATAKASGKDGGEASFFPPAMEVPALRYELTELYQDQKVRETVFVLLTQRYELARLDEARDTPSFQILDAPTLPTKPARPKKLESLLTGLMAGLILGGLAVFAPRYWRSLRQRVRAA